ncbi:MAG: TetR/AcrR family transcriptional regulator, partial [Thermoleophilaceae bacterium]
ENQRERILAAVADVISAASYAEMTVEDVIAGAGVSRRTFYEHFQNKEEAFLAAYDEAAARLLDAVRTAYESRAGFAERMRAGIEAFLGLLAANPAFARMCIVEVMAAGPEAVQRRNGAMAAFAAMIEQNALELLGDPPPSALTAETVVGGIYDVIYTRILEGEIAQLPALAPDLVYAGLLPYVGPDAAETGRGTGATPPPAPAPREAL